MTTLFDAIYSDDVSQVPDLIRNDPALVEMTNQFHERPIHEAIRYGLEDIVRQLIESGADINAEGNQGQTPLHYAALEDRPGIALLLLQHGADPEKADRSGVFPLFAASRASRSVADILVKHGARVDLNAAVCLGDIDRVGQLLTVGSSVLTVCTFPQLLIEDSVLARSDGIFTMLLDDERHPNALGVARDSSLLFRTIEQAMSDRDPTFFERLLNRNVPIDIENDNGDSLLDFVKRFQGSSVETPSQSDIKQQIISLIERNRGEE